jgi:hypothetical protein
MQKTFIYTDYTIRRQFSEGEPACFNTFFMISVAALRLAIKVGDIVLIDCLIDGHIKRGIVLYA